MRRWMMLVVVALMGLPFGAAAAGTPVATPTVVEQATIGGTALELVPMTKGKAVEVVAIGKRGEYDRIPVIVRNGTDHLMSVTALGIEAQSPDGSLLGAGEVSYIEPLMPVTLGPGEIAIGFAYLTGTLPDNARFVPTVTSKPGIAGIAEVSWNATISDATYLTDRVVLHVGNPTADDMTVIEVNLMCFADDGTPSYALGSYGKGLAGDKVPAHGTAAYQINIPLEYQSDCARFLVGGFGWGAAKI